MLVLAGSNALCCGDKPVEECEGRCSWCSLPSLLSLPPSADCPLCWNLAGYAASVLASGPAARVPHFAVVLIALK